MQCDYVPGLDMGKGYDPQTGAPKGFAVTYGDPQPERPGGQEVEYSLSLLESSESIQSAFGIDLAARIRALTWKASGKVELRQQSSISAYSVSLICRITVRSAVEHLTNVKLKPELEQLWHTQPDHFLSSYGTEYIGSRITGGEYVAYIEIQTSCSSDHKTLTASLSGGTQMFNSSAELQSKLDSVSSGRSVSIKVRRLGGKDGTTEQTVSEMMDRLRSFPAQVAGENGCTIGFISYPYTTLGLPPLTMAGAFQYRRNLLEMLANTYEDALRLEADIRYVMQFSDQFNKKDMKELAALKLKAEVLKGDIVLAIDTVAMAPLKDVTSMKEVVLALPSPALLREELPERFSHYRKTVTILARDPDWTDTGVRVFNGQRIVFDAPGQWHISQECDAYGLSRSAHPPRPGLLDSGEPWGALVCRIGSQCFAVGPHKELQITAGGVIELACNDTLDGRDNNSGSLAVSIQVGG